MSDLFLAHHSGQVNRGSSIFFFIVKLWWFKKIECPRKRYHIDLVCALGIVIFFLIIEFKHPR